MDDDVVLTTDEAALANRIQRLDARIDALEQRSIAATEAGMHLAGNGIGALDRQTLRGRRDDEHQRLLDERADLVRQLRHDVGDAG